MSTTQNVSTADLADRHRQFFALAMLGTGLIYLAKAAEHVAAGALAAYLDYVIVALAVIVVGSLLPAFVAKFRLPAGQKMVYFSEDGYVAQLLRRAFKASWATTFIGLVVLEVVLREVATELPAVFFIQVGLFTMLSVMSGTFLLLNWSATRDAKGDEA